MMWGSHGHSKYVIILRQKGSTLRARRRTNAECKAICPAIAGWPFYGSLNFSPDARNQMATRVVSSTCNFPETSDWKKYQSNRGLLPQSLIDWLIETRERP